MERKTLLRIHDRVAEGFRKALRKDASIRCSIPSSKTPGWNLVRGSALKKSVIASSLGDFKSRLHEEDGF